MIILAVITPFFVRGRQNKLKGITYKQLVWMCVGLGICGGVLVVLHFTTK